MLRIEIVANHSVEENILEAFAREKVGKYYTKYPNVFGVGSSGPRMGDAIWPEENFALVMWCEEEEARGIARAVEAVKERFPDEGIKLFGLPDESQISRFPVNPPAALSSAPAALSPAASPSPGPHTAPLHSLSASFVVTPPSSEDLPVKADQVETEYDGQNMEEI
ncbi:MAG: hypothetical protein LBT87_07215 [Treponema sp.]|jgi:hypothetical protein|nr:hypothetical protein [Treponema sp.]